MSKPLEDIDARAAGALTHPLRMAILWALEREPASPSELARRLDAPLEAVSYHVRKLHAVGLIEADEPEFLEGNVKHTYRLVARPWITEEAWEGLPTADRDAITYAILRRAWRTALAALAAGGMHRPDAHVTRSSMTLDEAGFVEVSAILRRATEEMVDAEHRAAERLRGPGSERLDATVVLFMFETPEADTAPEVLGDLYAYRDGRVALPAPSYRTSGDGREGEPAPSRPPRTAPATRGPLITG